MTSPKLRSEDALQAVVLADSFARRMEPVTFSGPKALLPLANTPLLEYALEFLAESGVKHVLIVCKAFAEEIEKFVAARKRRRSEVKVQTLLAPQCCSAGDVLRHLDSLEMVRSEPFVLMGAETVADVDLAPVISRHRETQRRNPQHIATVLFKRAERKHRLRGYDDDLVVAIAPDAEQRSGRLIAYENRRGRRCIQAEIEEMASSEKVLFSSDLMDTHIQVCSLEVLKMFAENFDMQSMDDDFFGHALGNALGYSVGVHVVDHRYAARVNCWNTYDAVSKDIMERWAFRFSLDHNVFRSSSYSYQRRNVYKEKGVRMAQSSVLEENVVIASCTSIGQNSFLSQTIVGHDCVIGSNVRITGSYLWKGVTIEDGVVIDRALVCDRVVVKSGAVIGKGALLSFGVVVGANVVVPPYTKVWVPSPALASAGNDDVASTGNQGETGGVSLGPGSTGTVYRPDEHDSDDDGSDDNDDGDDMPLDEQTRQIRDLAKASVNSLAPDEDAIAWWDEFRLRKASLDDDDSDAESVLTFDSDVDEREVVDEVDEVEWGTEQEQTFRIRSLYTEVAATIRRSIEQAIEDKDAVALEVASLKYSDNASMATYSASVFLAVFDEVQPRPVPEQKPSTDVLKSLGRKLREWRYLLDRYIQDDESEHPHVLSGLEMACLYDGKPYKPLFPFALNALYLLDMVSGEAILAWAEEKEAAADSRAHHLRVAADELVQTLRAESESETETDSDDGADE